MKTNIVAWMAFELYGMVKSKYINVHLTYSLGCTGHITASLSAGHRNSTYSGNSRDSFHEFYLFIYFYIQWKTESLSALHSGTVEFENLGSPCAKEQYVIGRNECLVC